MVKKALLSLAACTLIASCAQVQRVQHAQQLPTAIPALHILNDTSATEVKMSTLSIDVTVAANIATTTFDITFYNPNDRILEGEFEFPLADGQIIIRYALDIEGKLREGVVVEKAKGRIAFENTIRRKVDPGLVEKTKGNNFRTRIYPLPAKGTRHILIAVEQLLDQKDECLYQLPLYTKQPIDKFSINASVIHNEEKPEVEESGPSHLVFRNAGNDWKAYYEKQNYTANETITFIIPASSDNETIILSENNNGNHYFYVNHRIEAGGKQKRNPASIALLWDISSSAQSRNLPKEKELLRGYLAALGNVKLTLVPFHVFEGENQIFSISNGNSNSLLAALDKFQYDGGTQLGILDLAKYNAEEVLLFSDGISTFGKKEMVLPAVPVITVNSSPSADFSYLKYIAQQSRGRFIDLNSLETADGLSRIQQQSLQVISTGYDPAEIEDFVIQNPVDVNKGLSFAGKLKAKSSKITVTLGYGNDVAFTERFQLEKRDQSDYNQVKRIWATMKIAELDLRFEKNKDAITKLGKEFSVVTQNTSLIVLDRVEDYVKHKILPPVELQKEYFSLLKTKEAEEKDSKATAFTEALDELNELKTWWNTNYAGRKKVVDIPESTISYNNLELIDSTVVGTPDSVVGLGVLSYSTDARPESRLVRNNATDRAMMEEVRVVTNAYGYTDLSFKKDKSPTASDPSIELNEWKPDAPYLKELEKVATGDRRSKYFSLKKEYQARPSFFIDVARFFIEKNDRQFGIRVLSNVCEMKLEDASLLRMVANQLLDAGEKELAIETFKDIMNIREEEPQSYRDLALAFAEAGNHNETVRLLYKLILGTWDPRFGNIKGIALNEMNAVISANKTGLDISNIDSRFIYEMPVDVRIVIGWNADNSDIDLWVTDPAKEKCSYQNTQTAMGGRISRDVTQGYGPEEFLLKKAKNGTYSIDVNLFGDTRQTLGGPIFIKADLFTDYGRPTQKKRTINFRVTTNKEVVNLGSLKFGG